MAKYVRKRTKAGAILFALLLWVPGFYILFTGQAGQMAQLSPGETHFGAYFLGGALVIIGLFVMISMFRLPTERRKNPR